MKSKFKKHQQYFTPIFILILTILIVSGSVAIYQAYKAVIAKENAFYLNLIEDVTAGMTERFLDYKREIRFLSQVPPVQGIIRAKLGGGYDVEGRSSYKDWEERLKVIFESLMREKKVYMQIRYIDETGKEIVRVDYVDGKTARVPEEKLQDKADSYYFKEAMALPAGEVYISPIDLNREHGQIETPHKPTIRYAMPLFDQAGKRRGIIIVNALGQKILHTFLSMQDIAESDVLVIDKDGYYLHHSSDEKKEWGAPWDLNTGYALKGGCRPCLENMFSTDKGHFFCSEEKRYYFFKRLEPHPGTGLFWITAISTAKKKFLLPIYMSIIPILAIFAVILIIFSLISGYISRWLEHYEEIEVNVERRKFDSVVQQMKDGIVLCTADWKIIAANPSAQKYLGIEHSPAGNLLDAILEKYTVSVSKSELADTTQLHKTFSLNREETETFSALYLDACLDILRDQYNKNSEIILVMRNVSEERKEEMMRQDFLALISHKLKTPITVITQSAAMLEEGLAGGLNKEQGRLVGLLSKEAYNLSGLVEELLAFTAITRQRFNPSRETIRLKDDILAIIKSVIMLAEERKVESNIDCPDENILVNINKWHFSLIVKSLVENAIKFNDKDIVKLEVTVKKVQDKVEISIADNGRGIPPEEREKVFKGFYQIEKYFTGKTKGIGLGLALAKKLVEAYGGEIKIESELGKGTTFIFTLSA